MRYILQLSLVLAALIVGTSSVLACSCADPSVREKFREADVVFVGQLVSISDSNVDEFPNSVMFNVKERLKGAAERGITVLFGFDNPGWCGDLPLTKDERYLVYAYHEKGRLVTSVDCGPNRIAKYVPDEIKKLHSFWFRTFARFYPFPKF